MNISGGAEITTKETVGQEFIAWAEKYWHIDRLIKVDDPDSFADETCDYNYMRKVFIKKIDAIIQERLSL